MAYTVSKKFEADFAHRVYNQTTDGSFEPKCKNIHGHRYEFEIFLASNELIDDMVLDFNYLKPIKQFIDDVLDHRFVVSVYDEELLQTLNVLMQVYGKGKLEGRYNNYEVVSLSQEGLLKIFDYEPHVKLHHSNPLLNSITIIPTNTTAECLAKWMSGVCTEILLANCNDDVNVVQVIVKETPKCQAIYKIH